MKESGSAKCSCQSCGVHLEFAVEATGNRITCPNCGQPTELGAIPVQTTEPILPVNAASVLSPADIANAFGGSVPRRPTSALYPVGLLLVAIAMVLLPLCYVALILCVGWLTFLWATHATFLLPAAGGGSVKLVIYCIPLFAGMTAVFFLVKPLFAPRARQAQPLALNPTVEPLLYAFITAVCDAVGAARPSRIDVDCHLNAMASLRRGPPSLAGTDLMLTLGLPLVAALDLRQFAGVLAHEFGHFRQGFGMKLGYVIRAIDHWFLRVVYQRDAWDFRLLVLRQGTRVGWFKLLIVVAQTAVWFSRLCLSVLMRVGHGIDCFMSRQMEYAADHYQIKLVGSEVFEACTHRIHVLDCALPLAYKTLQASWNQARTLPESFPAYLLQVESSQPAAWRQEIEDTMRLATTGLFDTHPSNGDRIRRARQAGEPGVFHLDGPATDLFADFEVLARQVTALHYAEDLGIPMATGKLHPLPKNPALDQGGSKAQANA